MQSREFIPTDPSLAAIPRFCPGSFYLRTTHMRDRQAMKCCLLAFQKSHIYLVVGAQKLWDYFGDNPLRQDFVQDAQQQQSSF
jgi:hypothetical protein